MESPLNRNPLLNSKNGTIVHLVGPLAISIAFTIEIDQLVGALSAIRKLSRNGLRVPEADFWLGPGVIREFLRSILTS